jgi:hypothetical protein
LLLSVLSGIFQMRMEQAIPKPLSEAKRAEIIRALLNDPHHNAHRVAHALGGVSDSTVGKIARAEGIPLLARGRNMHFLWTDPEYAEFMATKISARRRASARRSLDKPTQG